MTVCIRPAEAEDVPAIVALVREVLAEHGLRFGEGSATDAQLTALPGSYTDRGGAFWVAADDGAGLLGTCGVFPIDEHDHELRKMYLRPTARGLGVGRALLERAVSFARERGARRLVLDTVEEMTRAIGFYEAHGFTRDDSQVRGARCTRGYALSL